MSAPSGLLNIDTEPGGLERFLFTHAQHHNNLIQAAITAGAKLNFYILDEIGENIDVWLFDHQRAHNDMGTVTGVVNSDLQTVDFQDPEQRDAWVQINWQEHQSFSAVLGV